MSTKCKHVKEYHCFVHLFNDCSIRINYLALHLYLHKVTFQNYIIGAVAIFCNKFCDHILHTRILIKYLGNCAKCTEVFCHQSNLQYSNSSNSLRNKVMVIDNYQITLIKHSPHNISLKNTHLPEIIVEGLLPSHSECLTVAA